MAMLRRTVAADVAMVGEDQVRIRMSTGQRARDGHILEPQGCLLDDYRANPIVLWQHDPDEPVGTNAEVAASADGIVALTTFAPAGVSATADKIRGLVKSGVIRAVSIGFAIIDGEPIDPARPRNGLRATKWELLECSFVSVPADTGAVVTARAMADKAEWKVGAARNLPIDDSDEWDGAAAQASIFEHAGGDEFDPVKARKGFLVYNAAEPKLRGSYKLPIARVVDGELKVPKEAIRAAASRLPQTDIPDDVKEDAQKVLDAYKKKAKIGDDDDAGTKDGRAFAAKRRRMLVANPKLHLRGLYDCAMLAYVLDQLGYAHTNAAWEAEIEGDDSAVPAMLGEALQKLGAALVAMTQEEVAELLAGHNLDVEADDDEDVVIAVERAFIAGAKTARARAWRRGIAGMRQRAGRVLSQGNRAALEDAHDHIKRAAGHATDAAERADVLGEQHDKLTEAHGRAAASHDKMAEAMEAMNGSAPEDVTKKLAKVQQHHRALGKHIDSIGERAAAIGETTSDAEDAIERGKRAIGAARRSVRSVLDAAADDPAVEDNELDDAAKTDRAFRDPDFRRRQAELLALAAP